MSYLDTQGQRWSVRHRGAAFVVLSASLLLALVGTSPAIAGTLPDPDVSAAAPPPEADATAAEFGISAPSNDTLFPGSSVTISGTKDAAGRVDVQSLTGGDPYCSLDAGTSWSCTFDAPTGRNTVTVVQYLAGNPTPERAQITVRALPAPTITGTSPIVTMGLITGTGFPGSGIVLSGSDVGDCPGIVQPSGFWSCRLSVTASGDYPVSARQTWQNDDSQPGGATPTVIVRVDRDPPAYPVFTKPSAGAQPGGQPTLFAGTGENGSRVDVFVDGTLVCSSSVGARRWSCAAALEPGQRGVQGIQWDAAGNPSGASPALQISIAGAPAPAPAPVPRPGAPVAPPNAPAVPSPMPVPVPSPSQTTARAPATVPGFPFFPPPVGGVSGLAPLDTWGTPTDYGAAIPTVESTGRGFAWLWALGLGVGFILLVALPLRLALAGLRGRFPRHYFARDHSALTASQMPLLRPRLTVAGAIAAAAVLAALAGGIQGEVRYLRLAVAIALALLILNGLSVVVATKLATTALGGTSRIRLVPGFLAIAAITALISRGGGIQPPIIVGVVIAASFLTDFGTRGRGLVATTQLVLTMAIGAAAWLGHSALGPVTGFLPSLSSEWLSSLCIAAIGSAVILSLPVSRMPGRLIFEWSPIAWAVVALTASTLAGVVIAGGATFPVPVLIGISLAFAAFCLALWAWIRLVEPSFPARRAARPRQAPSAVRSVSPITGPVRTRPAHTPG